MGGNEVTHIVGTTERSYIRAPLASSESPCYLNSFPGGPREYDSIGILYYQFGA